jgi:chromosomal replication initiation ATPase DnaA
MKKNCSICGGFHVHNFHENKFSCSNCGNEFSADYTIQPYAVPGLQVSMKQVFISEMMKLQGKYHGLSKNEKRVLCYNILERCLLLYGLTFQNLALKHRYKDDVDCRRAFCFICREIIGFDLVGIGLIVFIDHASVLHMVKSAYNFIETDAKFIEKIKQITYNL